MMEGDNNSLQSTSTQESLPRILEIYGLEQTLTNILILRNTPLYQSPKRSPTNPLHSSLTSQQQSSKEDLP